jgi:hypothetical protein
VLPDRQIQEPLALGRGFWYSLEIGREAEDNSEDIKDIA